MTSIANKTNGMLIDGVAASEHVDSSGEVLDIEGADISDLEAGLGSLNWEHRGDDAPGASPADHVGKIVYCKKLFDKADCENDRQRMYWDKMGVPYIYFIARLFDGSGHRAAGELAAIFRDYEANDEPCLVRYSIEGSTLEREGNKLTRTIARRVAATVKPCNRSCYSGVLADPNHPETPKTEPKGLELEEASKSEPSIAVDLLYRRLGGSEIEGLPILTGELAKAYTAGGTNAAPSTLTGGSALQVEDRSLRQGWVNQAKAAYRDRPKDGSAFKDFLKFRMPDADPTFIDSFARMVDDYHLHKGEELLDESLEKALYDYPAALGKTEDREAPPEDDDTSFDFGANAPPAGAPPKPKPVRKTPATVMKLLPHHAERFGLKKPLVKKPGESFFDDSTGTLHTDLGSFKMHIPDDQGYVDLLNHQDTQGPHDEAMRNWMHLHTALKAGKLPPEVVMHAAMFSGMSPAVPVPLQEFAYSHLQDLMARGFDPTKSGAADSAARSQFISGVLPGGPLPEYMRDFWASPAGDATRTEKGVQRGHPYPSTPWYSIENYHKLHPHLVDLVQQHGTDARTVVTKLMQHKDAAAKHSAKQDRQLKAFKKPDPDYDGPTVQGFAPKTTRYLLGMLGGSNVHVPDTHFIRHMFGLPQDDRIAIETERHLGRALRTDPEKYRQTETPFKPNIHLKRVLWDEKMPQIGEAMDRYYAAHHPAVKYVQQRFGLKGEDALFPAFWAHWLTIAPDERRRGLYNQNSNEGTDHRVYWNNVNRIMQHYGLPNAGLKKSEDESKAPPHAMDAVPLHAKTALSHATVMRLFGPTWALFHYYHDLAPLLLHAASKRELLEEPEKLVRKFESMKVELRKAIEEVKAPKGEQLNEPVYFAGKHVQPGVAHVNTLLGERVHQLIGQDQHNFYSVPHDKRFKFEASDVTKLPRYKQGVAYKVLQYPMDLDSTGVVDSGLHALPQLTKRKEQHELVHGLSFDDSEQKPPLEMPSRYQNRRYSEWRKLPSGQLGFVKAPVLNGDFPQARREAMFYNLATDVFGLGHYLPTTVALRHPKTGREHSVTAGIPNAEHVDPSDPDYQKAILQLGESGELDKMGLMDSVLSNHDRSHQNYMFVRKPQDGKPQIRLIDHGNAFDDAPGGLSPPEYWRHFHQLKGEYHGPVVPTNLGHDVWFPPEVPEGAFIGKLHPAAAQWAMSLSPENLQEEMFKQGAPPAYIDETVRRLRALQNHIKAKGGALPRMEAFQSHEHPEAGKVPGIPPRPTGS